jgi:hypothetical protein
LVPFFAVLPFDAEDVVSVEELLGEDELAIEPGVEPDALDGLLLDEVDPLEGRLDELEELDGVLDVLDGAVVLLLVVVSLDFDLLRSPKARALALESAKMEIRKTGASLRMGELLSFVCLMGSFGKTIATLLAAPRCNPHANPFAAAIAGQRASAGTKYESGLPKMPMRVHQRSGRRVGRTPTRLWSCLESIRIVGRAVVTVGNAIVVRVMRAPAALRDIPTAAMLIPARRVVDVSRPRADPMPRDPRVTMATPIPITGHPRESHARRGHRLVVRRRRRAQVHVDIHVRACRGGHRHRAQRRGHHTCNHQLPDRHDRHLRAPFNGKARAADDKKRTDSPALPP